MLTLLLMRHAKSEWPPEGQQVPDLERPLRGKGKRDAKRQGDVLNSLQLVPEIIVCSPAKRARATAKRVAESCGYRGRIEMDKRLYLMGCSGYRQVAGGWDDHIHCGMIIGHNPDISDLVQELTGKPVLLEPASIARLELPISGWQELRSQPSARLVAVLKA